MGTMKLRWADRFRRPHAGEVRNVKLNIILLVGRRE